MMERPPGMVRSSSTPIERHENSHDGLLNAIKVPTTAVDRRDFACPYAGLPSTMRAIRGMGCHRFLRRPDGDLRSRSNPADVLRVCGYRFHPSPVRTACHFHPLRGGIGGKLTQCASLPSLPVTGGKLASCELSIGYSQVSEQTCRPI